MCFILQGLTQLVFYIAVTQAQMQAASAGLAGSGQEGLMSSLAASTLPLLRRARILQLLLSGHPAPLPVAVSSSFDDQVGCNGQQGHGSASIFVKDLLPLPLLLPLHTKRLARLLLSSSSLLCWRHSCTAAYLQSL